MKLTIIYTIVLFHIASVISFGQSSPYEEDIVPPSPNVTAMNKYVDTPVSYYTGTAEVDVPLYEIKLNHFSLPISLSYHATGLRVDDYASWVGAGWALNGTGAVSRTTRGVPDEWENVNGRYGYLTDLAQLTFNSDGSINDALILACEAVYINQETEHPLTFGDSLATGLIDAQPDLFTYSYPGGGGKFVFDSLLNPVKLTAVNDAITGHPFESGLPDFKFTYPPDYHWEITDDKGIIYKYEKAETTYTETIGTGDFKDRNYDHIQTSWYLTEIIAHGEWIHFIYTPEPLEYPISWSETARIKRKGLSETHSNNSTEVTADALRLSKIITSVGDTIEFIANTARTDLPGSYRLDSIQIKTGGVTKLKYIFNYNCEQSNRLMLCSVQKEGKATSEIENQYKFEYNQPNLVPSYGSTAQDMWGFFNNHTGSRLPTIRDYAKGFEYLGGNRDANLYSKVGILEKVTYPTGGSLKLYYENHKYYDVGRKDYSSTWSVEASGGTVQNPTEDWVLFSTTENYYFWLEKEFSGSSINNYSQLFILDGGSYRPIESSDLVSGKLPEGNFKLYAKNDGTDPSVTATVTLEKPDPGESTAGGVRVTKLEYFDVGASSPSLTKKISYTDSLGVTTGKLFTTPVFISESTYRPGHLDNDYSCIPDLYEEYFDISCVSNVPMGNVNGSHIGYDRVTVEDVEPNGQANNGSTEYVFTNNYPFNTLFMPIVPPEDVSYKNGSLLEQNVYEGNTLKKSTSYTYETESFGDNIEGVRVYVKDPTYCPSCDNTKYGYNSYIIHPIWYKKTTAVTTTYEGDSLRQTVAYEYAGSHFNPTKETTTDSEDRTHITTYGYDPQLPGLLTNTEKKVNGVKVEGLDIHYNGGLPDLVKKINTAGQYENFIANTYAVSGALTYRIKYGVVNTTLERIRYLWNSNDSRVVAKILGDAVTFAYTTFGDEQGGWTYSINGITDTNYVTEGHAYQLSGSNGITDNIVGGNYTVTFLAKGSTSGVTLSAGGQSFPLVQGTELSNGFYHYKSTVTCASPCTVTLAASNSFIVDELRIHDQNSVMQTYQYDEFYNVISTADENNLPTFYEYDNFHRLINARDHNQNVLQSHEYNLLGYDANQ